MEATMTQPGCDSDVVDFLFDRVGKHMAPAIKRNMVQLRTPLPIRDGVCARTGWHGPIIDYPTSQHGLGSIPTLAKLVWLFTYQRYGDKDGVVKDQRLGSGYNQVMVLTETRTYTTVPFAPVFPRMRLLDMGALLRLLANREVGDFLFLAFTKSPSKVLGNNLRWSRGDDIEVNGDLRIGKTVVSNTALSLDAALQFTASDLTIEQLVQVYRLRAKDDRSDNEDAKLQSLIEQHNVSRQLQKTMRRATWQDVNLARLMRA
jgi:hypothetical protein